MKASPRAPHRFFLVLAALATATLPVAAQDAVVLESGATREGKITGVSGGNIRLKIQGGGSTGIPLTEIREIRMDPPPEFDAAASLLATGDAAGAVLPCKRSMRPTLACPPRGRSGPPPCSAMPNWPPATRKARPRLMKN